MAASRFTVAAVFKGVDKMSAPVSRMQNRITKFSRSARRGIRSVDRALKNVTGRMSASVGRVVKYGAAMAAIAAAITIRAMNRLAEAMDNLAKRSRRLEFPIEEFQEWQFVAEQSGLTLEGFDKSIEKFVKTVGEAKAGTGTLITILRKSNPELLKQVTSATSVADALDLYLEALRKAPDVMTRTALATAAFGRSGAKMLNITEQSSEAIAALRLEMRENGIVTMEQAAQAEAYNDAVNSLKRSFTGLLQSVFVPMYPAITRLVRGWREWIIENKALVSSRVIQFARDMREELKKLYERFMAYNDANDVIGKITEGVKGLVKVVVFLGEHGKEIAIITAAVYGLSAAFTLLNGILLMTPLGWTIMGLVAAAAAGYALVTYAGDIVDAFRDMPAALKIGLAPLWPIIKALEGLEFLASGKIGAAAFDAVNDIGNFFGDDEEEPGSGSGPIQLINPAERLGAVQRSENTERSVVDVNFNDLPAGASVSGGAPGLTLNTGTTRGF